MTNSEIMIDDLILALQDAKRGLHTLPKYGKWVNDRYCSNCEWSNEDVYFTSGWTGKYCPNCGAKMKGE